MKRKDFILNACVACLSATVGSSLLNSCTVTRYIPGNLVTDGMTVSKNEFIIKKKAGMDYRPFIIIRNDAFQYPVCVYRFSEQAYSAVWMRCTHQGAELQASGDALQCPAHGSAFNNKGQVINGPANHALRTFPVTVTNTELFIDLRKLS